PLLAHGFTGRKPSDHTAPAVQGHTAWWGPAPRWKLRLLLAERPAAAELRGERGHPFPPVRPGGSPDRLIEARGAPDDGARRGRSLEVPPEPLEAEREDRWGSHPSGASVR